MTKRIRHSVQTLGAALALVFIFQACGGSNTSPMTGTPAGTHRLGRDDGRARDDGPLARNHRRRRHVRRGRRAPAFGEPACLSAVAKGVACAATDSAVCYKTCGPEKSGVKSETCTTAGIYAEMSGCSFDPAKDFACYKIPAAANTVCPAGVTPQASHGLHVAECTVCNSTRRSASGGVHRLERRAPRSATASARRANAAGTRTWSCASDTAWPCPLGSGC